MPPIETATANVRSRCLTKAIRPAARSGIAGINQRFLTNQFISSFCAACAHRSSLERVHPIEIRRLVMPVYRDDQGQAHSRFRSRDAD
jgi:hypothetical protein